MYDKCLKQNIGVATWWEKNQTSKTQAMEDWLLSVQSMNK